MKITTEYLRRIIKEELEEVSSPFKGIKKGPLDPAVKAARLEKSKATKTTNKAYVDQSMADYEKRKASGEFSDESMASKSIHRAIRDLGENAARIYEENKEAVTKETIRAIADAQSGGEYGVGSLRIAIILFKYA